MLALFSDKTLYAIYFIGDVLFSGFSFKLV